MYMKELTYTDYDDVERTEKFYFNLSKAELMEMNLSANGGFDKKIQAMIDSKDTAQLINLFKDIIIKSYGIKSDDGKRFIKTPEVKEEFLQTVAYSELFMLFATDANEAQKFINGIIPKDLASQVAANSVNTVTALPSGN